MSPSADADGAGLLEKIKTLMSGTAGIADLPIGIPKQSEEANQEIGVPRRRT
jgi:hypothetical protein